MASGITRDIGAAGQVAGAVADQQLVNERMKRLGLSPTQVELNRLYAYYRTAQHDACAVGWDGDPHVDAVSREGICSSPLLPAGYEDVGKNLSNLPLKYRRPAVPCHLCHVIVSRFTELLFTESQSPAWKMAGDPDSESWVQAVTKDGALWSTMTQTRDLGGAMGTGIPGFKIIDSVVMFETFDRRWCFPTFDPAKPGQLSKLEIRYMYPKEERNPETGQWEEKKYWYRRTIDTEADVLWKPQDVGDGSTEPKWDDPTTVQQMVKHGYGFVPIEWIPNLPVSDDIDGDPDCLGCYDYFDRIGELDSQCYTGAARNADPTPVLSSDGMFEQVKLGSATAVKTEKGGSLGYAESTGSSITIASTESDRFQKKALQLARCVLPDEEGAEVRGAVTATEINKRTASMHAKASLLRQQYGRGATLLMQKLLEVARKMGKGQQAAEPIKTTTGQEIPAGTLVRSEIKLPPKVDKEGHAQPERLGDVQGVTLELVWPPFSQPTASDTLTKTQATVQARVGRLISIDTAVRHLAPDFNIDDTSAEVEALKKEPAPGGDLAAQSLKELQEGR
jgi:hypothetical protein